MSFAGQERPLNLFIRAISVARAGAEIGMADLFYKFQRVIWLKGWTGHAA